MCICIVYVLVCICIVRVLVCTCNYYIHIKKNANCEMFCFIMYVWHAICFVYIDVQ